jgi:hypothetical protein
MGMGGSPGPAGNNMGYQPAAATTMFLTPNQAPQFSLPNVPNQNVILQHPGGLMQVCLCPNAHFTNVDLLLECCNML